MKILFVCTGNTCRSPMAEALMTSLVKERQRNISVASRGTSVFSPERASENAVQVMARYGLDLSTHFSKPISARDVEEADFILTMAESHKRVLKRACAEANTALYTLKEFIGEEGEIKDPFGGSEALYEDCAKEIIACLVKLDEKLQQTGEEL